MMVQLFPSQQAILDEVKDRNRCAFYLGCGAGKTFIGSEKLISFKTPFNLVVCQKSQVDYWINHFQTHYPEVAVTDLTKLKRIELSNIMPGVMVINYDLIYRRDVLLSLRNFSLMLDESSLIQNNTAKRTKFILKLKPNNVVLLSGTPVSGGQLDKDEGLIFGKYENMLSQVKLLGWNLTSKEMWNTYVNWQYVYYGDMQFKDVYGYKRIMEFNSKLKELGCVFRRTEDIVDLPPVDEQTIYVSRPSAYAKMQSKGIVEIDGEELVGDFPPTKLLRLRQICANFNPEKASALSDLLDTLENERVVVFYNFKAELDVIKKAVGDRPLYQINGDVKDFDENTFGNSENYNAIIAAQYFSGSKGHNMQAAKYIIYLSVTDRAEAFDQSRGRIRRAGQKADRVMYYHLVTKNSVEVKELASVRAGVDYTPEQYVADYGDI